MSEQQPTAQQPQPGIAVNMTSEQATEHLKRVAAGVAPAVPASVPQQEPPAELEQSNEGFEPLNPPIDVYHPTKENETVRGFVLGSFTDGPTDAPFYLLSEAKTGRLVAVYEAPSLKGLGSLLPMWQSQPSGKPHATMAYEVIIDPFRRAGEGWDFLIMSRQVVKPTITQPPAWPVPEGPAPYSLDATPARRGALKRSRRKKQPKDQQEPETKKETKDPDVK